MGIGPRDLPPALPAVEIAEVVGAHDPDEATVGQGADEVADGLERVAEAVRRLEVR